MTRHPATEGHYLRPSIIDAQEPDGIRIQGTPVGEEVVGFPTLIDDGRDVTIPSNHQQVVIGEVRILNGTLTFGENAELRVRK
jgi:hypothetical protein